MTVPTWQHILDRELDEIDRTRTQVLPARRATAIATAVGAAGRGGRTAVAAHLGVSVGAVDQMIKRARAEAPDPRYALPDDTLARLLALELREVPPLRGVEWDVLAYLVHDTVIDVLWLEQPGELLAQDLEEIDVPDTVDAAALAAVCRSWTRVQGVAVLDCCLRADVKALPTQEEDHS